MEIKHAISSTFRKLPLEITLTHPEDLVAAEKTPRKLTDKISHQLRRLPRQVMAKTKGDTRAPGRTIGWIVPLTRILLLTLSNRF